MKRFYAICKSWTERLDSVDIPFGSYEIVAKSKERAVLLLSEYGQDPDDYHLEDAPPLKSNVSQDLPEGVREFGL